MKLDYDKIIKLLQIMHQTSGYPNLKPINDEVVEELNAIAHPKEEHATNNPPSRPVFPERRV